MTCHELIDFLDRYVARELDDDVAATFDRHLAACTSCVAYLDSYRETIRIARAATAAPALTIDAIPEELVRAVLASIAR